MSCQAALCSPVVEAASAGIAGVTVVAVVIIQIDGLGVIAILGDGQTVVPVAVILVDSEGVVAAGGGANALAVQADGSACHVALKADAVAAVIHAGHAQVGAVRAVVTSGCGAAVSGNG